MQQPLGVGVDFEVFFVLLLIQVSGVVLEAELDKFPLALEGGKAEQQFEQQRAQRVGSLALRSYSRFVVVFVLSLVFQQQPGHRQLPIEVLPNDILGVDGVVRDVVLAVV